ncbi:hypothetical protein HQ584_08320 [Patescibacteria group bacterium]|nr:hypothetical protein [Patescibacteria group bacterium]
MQKDRTINQWGLIKRKVARLVLSLIHPKDWWGVRDIDVDRKRFLLVQLYLDSIGFLYYQYKRVEEYTRVRAFNLTKKISQIRIIFEVLYHSRMLIYLLVLIFGSVPLFVLNPSLFTQITVKDINQILTVYAGGLIALLGIIFALYSVGFQTTTEKFSTDVTDYLNSEEVSRFLFKLMAFSSLFSLANLVIQSFYSDPVYILLIPSTMLVMASLLAVLIFKDDFINKLKPKQVFQRLYRENISTLRVVNAYDNPPINSFRSCKTRNVRSFKLYLPTLSSWSLIGYSQKNFSERLDICFNLYNDLIKDNKIEDATFGILSSAYLFSEYISVKHFIDTKFGWWFPETSELVKSDNPSDLTLKLNYEAQGIGRFSRKVKKDDWVEGKILHFLKRIQDNTNFKIYPLIGNSLINAYEVIMAGTFTRRTKGYERNLLGSIENQYEDMSKKAFQQYMDLGNKLCGIEDCTGNFINTFAQIKTSMMDGFNNRYYPGKLNKWKSSIKLKLRLLIKEHKLIVTKEEVISWKLSKYFNMKFLDLLEKLEIECLVEGHIITDKTWLAKDFLEKIEQEEAKVFAGYVDLIIPSMVALSKTEDSTYKNYVGGIILSIFNQLINQNKWKNVRETIKRYKKELLVLFISIDIDAFIETELRNQIDHGIFSSLVKREKSVYFFYLGLFNLTQFHLSQVMDRTNNHAILETLRRPLVLGGLAYLVSELDQDSYYISTFTHQAEYFTNNQKVEDLYQQLIEIEKRSGFEYFNERLAEDTRYRHFYRHVINSISELPKDYIARGGPPFGMSSTETVKHDSTFIRKMAAHRSSDMRKCQEGYVEWLKKRRQIQKLIEVLNLRLKYE